MVEKIKELEGKISTLEQTLSSLVTRVADSEGNISVVAQTVNDLQSRIDTKADKDKVIAAINISEEGIRIKGDKIHVDKNTLIDHGTFNN